MSCKTFEDGFEDGASENDHALRIRLIGGWRGLRCRR